VSASAVGSIDWPDLTGEDAARLRAGAAI